ncbi:vacuolar segregation subunit 7-domain-containing protein [Tuber brumale]|nr:vacuolar segregation subunit 7-domain-containing protein [Tuber brumale]
MSTARAAVNNRGPGSVAGNGVPAVGNGGVDLGGGGGGGSGAELDGHSHDRINNELADAEKHSRDSSPMRRNTSSAGLSDSNTSTSTLKKNRKPNAVRSAAPSRETSPTRSGTPAVGSSRNAQPQSQPDLHQPRPHRPLANAPHWPPSTRLAVTRTPPPDSRSPALSPQKKGDRTNYNTLTGVPQSVHLLREGNSEDLEESGLASGMRTPRSNNSPALETVVESSLPSTSKTLTEQVAALINRQQHNTIPEEPEGEKSGARGTRKHRTGSIASSIAPRSQAESESESGYKSEEKATYANNNNSSRAPPSLKGFARRPAVMGGDNFSRNMTVETETVSSVPQVAVGAAGVPGGASIRSKKSSDTIRAPKKEKKKPPKRTGGGGPANPSSKADLFARRVAEAVDEANSSDSEETFVYESNPPEAQQRPTSRFHSRTPSATSIQGGPDPQGLRLPLLSSMDGNQSTRRGRMKFASASVSSNANAASDGAAGEASGDRAGGGGPGPSAAIGGAGGSRSEGQSGSGQKEKGGSSKGQNGHRDLSLEESPFSSSHKSSAHPPRAGSTLPSRQSTSGRHGSGLRNGGNGYGSKKLPRTWASYEAGGEGAGDERVPLINRPGRNHRHGRRPGSGTLRQLEHSQIQRRGWFRTYICCIVAVFAVLLIMTGVGGFLFATTKALQEVKVLQITGVLVSKQELMLDLIVSAVNPNAIPVVVGSMDVNLFAKSAHVGDGKGKDGDGRDGDHDGDGSAGDDDPEGDPWWRLLSRRRKKQARRRQVMEFTLNKGRATTPLTTTTAPDGVDEGTDPPEDLPEQDRQTMLLGRIFSFDSALSFDGSPLRHRHSISVGELRLAKPGNKTEEGGTERWERVLQHPFELIVRGVLKYQLPLSGRVRTAPIGASVLVHPDGAASAVSPEIVP